MRQEQPFEDHQNPSQSLFDDCLEWTHWIMQHALDNGGAVLNFVVLAAAAFSGLAMISNAPVAEARNRQPIREYDEAYCYSDGYCTTRHARVFQEGDPIVTEYEYNLRDNNFGRQAFHLDPRFQGRPPAFHPNRNENNPINIAGDFNARVDHPNPNHPFHANNQGLFRHAPPGYRRDPGNDQNFRPPEHPDVFRQGPRN